MGWRKSGASLVSFDFDGFFNRFKYKIRLEESFEDNTYAKPKDIITHFTSLNKDFKTQGYNFISDFNIQKLDKVLKTIHNEFNHQIDEICRLSQIRSKFIRDFVTHRHEKLIELLK